VPISNLWLGRKLKTVIIAATWLSKLGFIASGTEYIIKDSTKEISDSNKGGEKSKNKDIINGYYKYLICEKYVKIVSIIWNYEIYNYILYLSYTAIKDWRCPLCYKDPL
jgi:hypothetical protein